jgi:hypothetical protein
MNKDQVQKYLYGLYEWAYGAIDPNYDPTKDIHPQPIYRRHEFAQAAEHLMSFKDALVEEFLKGKSLAEVINAKGRNVMQKHSDRSTYIPSPDDASQRFPDAVTEILRTPDDEHGVSKANPEGWKNIEFKYHDPYSNVHWDIDPDYAMRNFPTAYKLVQEYGDDCPIASYSYMAPGTILNRHTGPENRDGDFIRVHIPLIIPPGDVFFEVDGEEIDWSDIFAFDNQLVHSAHNLTNEHRLIFLIDIRRTRIGLPQGQLWNKDRQLYSLLKPFERKPK